MIKIIKKSIPSMTILITCIAIASCKKEESKVIESNNNYLCVITSNQALAPSSLATEIFRDFVENRAACDRILEEYRSGARTP